MDDAEREAIDLFGRILWRPVGGRVPTKSEYVANAFAAYQRYLCRNQLTL